MDKTFKDTTGCNICDGHVGSSTGSARYRPANKEKDEADHYDEGKPRVDLVPPELMMSVGEVLGKSTEKYGDRNWEKGMEWGKVYGSLQRHLNKFWGGEDIDPESGICHLHHAAANLSFLIAYRERNIGKDTRNGQ
jgi:hypothetical protein